MADQSTNVPYANGMNYGMGVNLLNGAIPGKAIDAGEISGPTQAGGQTVTYNLALVKSFEDLYNSLGISVEASGHYGLFSASGKFSYAKESNFNSQATFLLARCVVQNAFTQAENAQVKPEAAELLRQGDVNKFKERYGDGFVRGMQTGGEFFAVISITSSTQEEQESLAASLQAKYGGFFTSVDVSAKLDDNTKSKISRSELKVSTFQRGGTGDELSLTSDIESVMARLKAFPSHVEKNPVPYEVQVASYNTLALPDGPNPIDIQAQKDALMDYARIQVKLLSIRNDVEFVQLHPEFYLNPPPNSILNEWNDFITTQLNQLTRHASRCADSPVGGCQLFTLKLPDGFSMPERKLTTVPNISGSWKRSDGLVITFDQNDTSIVCHSPDPSFDHVGVGQWNGSFFDYNVTRRNLQNGCVTIMFARLMVPAKDTIKLEVTGTDGQCDLPVTFTENSIWFKKN